VEVPRAIERGGDGTVDGSERGRARRIDWEKASNEKSKEEKEKRRSIQYVE
jgi:hypothetical protein